MARCLSRALLATTKHSQSFFSVISRSTVTRPLVAAISYYGPSLSTRGFATLQTPSPLRDTIPWDDGCDFHQWLITPKDTILLDGCDFHHWLVVMEEKPQGKRDEIIDGYIKTLAMVLGSEEEARMKIYSVSTRYYSAFGANVPEEIADKIKELPNVRWVLADSYLDVRNKDYGGEPFINGQAVPYDPKYHEEWVRMNDPLPNEGIRINDRPCNFDIDRSKNFDRRSEGQMSNNQNHGGRGSRKTQRIPSQVKIRVIKCSRCRMPGHNRRTCKEVIG